MNRAFIFKIIGMLVLITLMSIAVGYVNGIILERQQRQNEVKTQIAKNSAGEQTIVGPVLMVPYTEEYPHTTGEGKDKKTELIREEHLTYVLPENLTVRGSFSNEFKKLGIYKALSYQLGGDIKGDFRIPANFNLSPEHTNGIIIFKPAYLSIGISDSRGIHGKPVLTWQNKTFKFLQGSQLKALGNGIHANIGLIDVVAEQTIPFAFNLNLRGMENFNFTPIADNNQIALQSSWQHPHFGGSFLPEASSQKINAGGFSANWAVSSLASSNQAQLASLLENSNSNQALESLSIGFVEPINVYSQADRATKYGLLFIGLTFAGFFIFELMKQLRIHPAQYTMVGLAMAMFYLLLISLAEQLSFALSYFIASAACVLLLGYYLSFVLKSKAHGTLFAVMLTALYGALYGILASEDNALIMGSLLVFGLLALVMVITRRVDWYQIGSKPAPQTYADHNEYTA